jgi:hypothetical protein
LIFTAKPIIFHIVPGPDIPAYMIYSMIAPSRKTADFLRTTQNYYLKLRIISILFNLCPALVPIDDSLDAFMIYSLVNNPAKAAGPWQQAFS